jgi:hypothetical protein
MMIEHIPLLQIQRDLHEIPRGMERFQEYLRTMVNDEGDDLEVAPLVMMNPMGREHVSARLDELLDLGADAIATEVAKEATARLAEWPGYFRHGLVIVDDLRGGWTNRYSTDAGQRIGVKAVDQSKATAANKSRHNWISTILWVSETPSADLIRASMLVNIYRTGYVQRHGTAETLAEIMAQEGAAAAFAGIQPHLDAEDIEYSREVLRPLLDESAFPICMAALFGDEAARSLGYEPLGLSDRAGLAVAAADAVLASRAEDASKDAGVPRIVR